MRLNLLFGFLILLSSCAHSNKAEFLKPTTENISKILKANQVSFRRCFQTDLHNIDDPERLKGQVEFSFSVDDHGTVIKADIHSPDMKDQDLLYCMKTKLKEISFPPAVEDSSYDSIQKLDFYPKRVE